MTLQKFLSAKVSVLRVYIFPYHNIYFPSGSKCYFKPGDGDGARGDEIDVGKKPSAKACIDACIMKDEEETGLKHRINGVTIKPYSDGSVWCYWKL